MTLSKHIRFKKRWKDRLKLTLDSRTVPINATLLVFRSKGTKLRIALRDTVKNIYVSKTASLQNTHLVQSDGQMLTLNWPKNYT